MAQRTTSTALALEAIRPLRGATRQTAAQTVKRLTPRDDLLIRYRQLERGVLDEIAPPSAVEEPLPESSERGLHSLLPLERLEHRSALRARERGSRGNPRHAARATGHGVGERGRDTGQRRKLPATDTGDVDPRCRRRDIAGAQVAFGREQIDFGLRDRGK